MLKFCRFNLLLSLAVFLPLIRISKGSEVNIVEADIFTVRT